MTRQEYLAELRLSLRTLPASDVTDICGDFEEHFAIGLSQGKTEHEISAELGDPVSVAQTYLMSEGDVTVHASPAAVNTQSSSTGTQTAAAGKDLTIARLFVILFNIFVMLSIAFTIFGVLISFWICSVSLLVGGIAALASLFTVASGWEAVAVLAGIAMIAFSIVSGIVNYFLCKWTFIGCKSYIRWNKKIYNEGF
jgi:uncharacterized membrane protein